MSIIIFILIIYFLDIKSATSDNISHLKYSYNNNSILNSNLLKNNFHNDIDKPFRKLSEPHNLVIHIDSDQLKMLYYKFGNENQIKEFKIINSSIYKAKETIEKLIKIKKPLKSINAYQYANNLTKAGFDLIEEKYRDNNINADLIVLIRNKEILEANIRQKYFAIPNIIAQDEDNRIIIGYLAYNYEYELPGDNDYKEELLTILFLHQFTHLLGFDITILKSQSLVEEKLVKSRIKENYINKYVVKSNNVIKKAKDYYNCQNLEYLELRKEVEIDNLIDSHWESRLLLGDYMSSDIYYPEQVISEITLALLEDLGWYEINYYTGGLMRFGKNKGCDFIENDCINVLNISYAFPNFYNEFCSSDSFGTCSSGRQSRGYCYNKEIYENIQDKALDYIRNGLNRGYGKDFIEYCPITIETRNNNKNYFYGNCKFGNNSFGDQLNEISYNSNSIIFGEKIGENSFCALSSLFKISQNAQLSPLYKNVIRPTCYSMKCSKKSLTIILYSQNENEIEYIVCPRKGGLIRINKDSSSYSKYKGYIFCPDYNLICTGTKICNNIFDCVEKESLYENPVYDYTNPINYISSEIKEGNKNDNDLNDTIIIEGFEESEDGTCPVNCSQCISHKRCILCRNFNNSQTEPKSYYIGEIDNEISHINCSSTRPSGGYYMTYKNEHIHYFKCIENCNLCSNASKCEQCLPTHKIKKDDFSCIDKIPNCIKYNETYFHESDPENNGGKGYIECLHCDNENKYFCLNMNKNSCELVEDYTDKTYYKMEDNKQFSCIQKCSIKFDHCKECVKESCKICEPEFYLKSPVLCEERIPYCIKYNESLSFYDPKNGGGLGYKECEQCNIDLQYYCFNNNKTTCEKLNQDIKNYYKMDGDDNPYSCIRECKLEYPYCLECNRNECTKCIVDEFRRTNRSCFPPIEQCKEYIKYEEDDIEYLNCTKCNQSNNYYCLNDNRKKCELISNISHYYKIDDNNDFSCLIKCENTFPDCRSCNKTICFECNDGYILSNKNKTKCLPVINPEQYDKCEVLIHNIDINIEKLDFIYFIDYYFINSFPSTKYVDHFVNEKEKYTVTLFIHSKCTEDLLYQGYYKIDSNDLYKEMYEKANIEANEVLFSIFVTYNYQNHFRFHDIYSEYINNEVCPNCLNIPYTITNKYPTIIKNVLGPLLSGLLNNENINLFSKDSDIFTDQCSNVTLGGIDIPFNERLYYLYLHDYSTQIACNGIGCELIEINNEESTSTCKCKMGNTFEEILNPKIEFKNYEDENIAQSNSLTESLKIIQCAKNGFKGKNIAANVGFFIALIAIVLVITSFISYCICSKVINLNLEKLANPPPKLKNRILIYSDWGINANNNSIENNNVNLENNLVQSRDEDDGNITEEDLTFTNNYEKSSFSINTEIGYIKKSINYSKESTNRLSDKNTRKILVLLSNKRRIKNNDKKSQTSEFEHKFMTTDETKKKDKNTFCQIYWFILSIKQHIINFFSCVKCCKITESYVPLPMRFIKSLFIIVLSFLLNILFLNQNYYSQKFKYYNQKYKLIASQIYEYEVKLEEVSDEKIPASDLLKYAFDHTIIYSIIVFIILLVIQLIIGKLFFSLRNSVLEVIKKNDLKEIKNLVVKTTIKNIIFFILTVILLIIFMFTFIGFGGAYGGAYIDYLVPGLISIAFLEIFPFIWSFILAILRYIGIKKNKKCCFDFTQFFLF